MKKALTLLIAIFLASNMYAQPVTLDPTFGENGMTVTLDANWGDEFDFDKSGNIISIGSSYPTVVIIKTNADGIIDQNFGTNGKVDVPENYCLSGYTGLKITNENKILLLGSLYEGNPEVVLRRFNEDGSVDKTFGDNGIMNLSSLTGAYFPIFIRSVNLENDNFMLIAVTEYIIDDHWIAVKSYISKYNYDGELDESFGENGKAYLTDNNMFNIHPRAIKILNDQSILIAGYDNFNTTPYRRSSLAFCKLSSIGNFITDFANNGIWINDGEYYDNERFYSIIEDTNGNLVFACNRDIYSATHYFIYSFYSDGAINSGFGTNGYYRPYFNVSETGRAVYILQNGSKYLIRNRHNIMSINHNGTLDTNFNNTGIFRCENSTFRAMRLQESTKLIVLGSFNNNFAIARLNIPYEISIKETPCTENRINVFPNPTTGELKIENGELRIENVEIFDVYGRKLLSHHLITSSSNHLINIVHLPAGIYFVRITTEKGEVIKKIVKQ